MIYQVGWLEHFHPDDPVFDTLREATEYAVRMSLGDEQQQFGAEMAVGIWSSPREDCRIRAIVYEGQVFKAKWRSE